MLIYIFFLMVSPTVFSYEANVEIPELNNPKSLAMGNAGKIFEGENQKFKYLNGHSKGVNFDCGAMAEIDFENFSASPFDSILAIGYGWKNVTLKCGLEMTPPKMEVTKSKSNIISSVQKGIMCYANVSFTLYNVRISLAAYKDPFILLNTMDEKFKCSVTFLDTSLIYGGKYGYLGASLHSLPYRTKVHYDSKSNIRENQQKQLSESIKIDPNLRIAYGNSLNPKILQKSIEDLSIRVEIKDLLFKKPLTFIERVSLGIEASPKIVNNRYFKIYLRGGIDEIVPSAGLSIETFGFQISIQTHRNKFSINKKRSLSMGISWSY